MVGSFIELASHEIPITWPQAMKNVVNSLQGGRIKL